MLNPSRDKMQGRYGSGEGGDEPTTVCDPGSELRLRGSRTRRVKVINGMEI